MGFKLRERVSGIRDSSEHEQLYSRTGLRQGKKKKFGRGERKREGKEKRESFLFCYLGDGQTKQ